MTSAALRRARPEDERAFYDICLLTGDSGADASTLYKDPQLLGHVYAVPYLRFAPDFAFVLEDAEGVGGVRHWPRRIRRHSRRRWNASGGPFYASNTLTLPTSPVRNGTPDQRMINLIHHPNRTHDDLQSEYPAHLHIDLLPRMQGEGTASGLCTPCWTPWKTWAVRVCTWALGAAMRTQ
ncbi:GNAT family N-acetyltransferase [Deinococcus cavernae]|uniref:GNAT family N-acetyltransferase n=1 Tax=Deinococcus cavernae TaxID=2320857 RepID=UPI001F1DAE8D|nr:GNAT family N-acetyltransferase [Deinococcus cavernae]